MELPTNVSPVYADDRASFPQVDDVSYTVYEPRKLKLGLPHPDPVVENNSMAAVDPPDLWYRLKLQVSTNSRTIEAQRLQKYANSSKRRGRHFATYVRVCVGGHMYHRFSWV